MILVTETLNTCNSLFLCIELLSPHFSAVRYDKRLIYKINEHFSKLNNLDKSLESAELETLLKITEEMEREGNLLDRDQKGLCLNEDEIQNKYKTAFIAFTKRSLDTPRYKWIFYQIWNLTKNVTDLTKLRNPILSRIWHDLINSIIERDPVLNSDFVCTYCLKKIRGNTLPSTCIVNNLHVRMMLTGVNIFNGYEKLLIQRAKSFQVIHRWGTVGKKNMPHSMRIQQLKGQVFYLALALEETLNENMFYN